jgi:hypothetical protein
VVTDKSVESRLLSFHYDLHFNDETLAAYGLENTAYGTSP